MKFLCGRPGCGKESTATLQIDAPAEMVSLVDPRVSRDGVPLCARHADATTPPVGWTMNDLRSRNRALAAVPDEVPSATPPRVRPEGEASPASPGTVGESEPAPGQQLPSGRIVPRRSTAAGDDGRDFQFRSSRPTTDDPATDPGEPVAPVAAGATAKSEPAEDEHGPDSRPARRREAAEQVEEPEERFPWHHQYKDDEPEEMQASSPLLSRAFRSSTG